MSLIRKTAPAEERCFAVCMVTLCEEFQNAESVVMML